MENTEYWNYFTSNLENRTVITFIYLLIIGGFDYLKLKKGKEKNSSETIRPPKLDLTPKGKTAAPIINKIDPKTMMANYVAPTDTTEKGGGEKEITQANEKTIPVKVLDIFNQMADDAEKDKTENDGETQTSLPLDKIELMMC